MNGCRRMRAIVGAASLALAIAGNASAAVLYSQNFDVDDGPNWTVNGGPGDEAVNFFFNYADAGIPSAPNSTGGSTRGLNLQANMASGVFSGVSVSPTGRSFSGNHQLKFDWWSNFNGPAPTGGSGSTQLSTFGIGTTGELVQWPGGTQDSIWFAATGDGNSASDWRVYSPTAPTRYADTVQGIHAAGAVAGSTNSSNSYYATLGAVQPPTAQTGLFAQQTGTTLVGSSAFEWHEVIIERSGSSVTWRVDGLLIATVPADHDTASQGGNFFLGHADTNATSSTDPNDTNLLFTLIDNVQVIADLPGDFDDSGAIDLTDYLNLSSHLLTDLSGLTVQQSYSQGDFTRDLRIDGLDFVQFRKAYDDFNGVGAFVAMLGAVPEPSTGLLTVLACGSLVVSSIGRNLRRAKNNGAA